MTIPIILDTDIGTDVDDALALAYALRHPEVEVLGVTTVYGDVRLRARIVLRMLRLAGRGEVAVGVGREGVLSEGRDIFWGGWEGEGFLQADEDLCPPELPSALELMKALIAGRSGEVVLVAVGPLTNVAVLLREAPEVVRQLRGIVVMGGFYHATAPEGLWSLVSEHNMVSDAEAAQEVFAAGVPVSVVSLDVTATTWIDREDERQLRESGDEMLAGVAEMLGRYIDRRDVAWTRTHDPLAVAVAVDESLVQWARGRVHVETKGEYTTGATVLAVDDGGPHRVSVGLDEDRFHQLLMRVLLAGGAN